MPLHVEAIWTPTQDEFDRFARISGDDNPIHVDPAFSARTRFGRTVSHGMLIYSKLWAMLCTSLPGVRQAHQTMMFPNPCFTGEPVELTVEEIGTRRFAMKALRQADGAELLVGETELA